MFDEDNFDQASQEGLQLSEDRANLISLLHDQDNGKKTGSTLLFKQS